MSRLQRAATLRSVLLAILVGGAAVGIALAGRWEERRAFDRQNAGIVNVVAAIGPALVGPRLTSYRVDSGLACLIYRDGGELYALELCVDANGRVLEVTDRRRRDTEVWSITWSPQAATQRVDQRLVVAAIRTLAPDAKDLGPLTG